MKKNVFSFMKEIIGFILSFILFLVTFEAFSENEPNNSIETANILALNGSISGSFSVADNSSDYYKVITTSDGKLTIQLSSDVDLCVSLSILNETGLYNLYNNGNCGTGSYSKIITINNLAAGTYYLWAGNSGNGNYSISNTFVANTSTNDIEPNDEIATAASISPNSEKSGHLGYRKFNTDSYDYYKITTTADGKLSINLSSDNTLCIDLSIYNENGFINLYSNGYCSNSNHSNLLVVNNLAAGTYIILASAVGYGSYSISNSLVPTMLVNDKEPNNSIETALAFSQSGEVTGHLGYRNTQTDDYDYYKIVTNGNINLNVNVSSDPTLCVNMTLLNSTGGMNLLSNGSCGNGNHSDSMVKYSLSAGTYYLEVGSVGYGSYRIKTSFSYITGIDLLSIPSEGDLKIFPNPAKSELFISSETLTNPEIRIYDLNGSLHMPFGMKVFEKHGIIDISNFNSGMYFIELKQDNKVLISKFIKE